MAKICINQNCEKEIPGSALYCTYCGTQQVADGELTEEEKLRKELCEAEETIKILKKSLADAHNKVEIGASNERIQALENQLANEQTKQKNLQNQIAAKNKEIEQLKLLVNKKRKNGGLIFFMIVFLLSTIGLGVAYFVLNDSVAYYRNGFQNLESRLQEKESSQEDIRKEKEKLQQKVDDISAYYPIIIKSLKIGNVYSDGTIETYYGNSIYAYNSMYLQPQIEYVSLKPYQTITLYHKLYKDGELIIGASSPSGYYTTKDNLYLSEEGKSKLSGWGYENKGYWSSGSYRYEIWYNNMCLKTVNFYLY
jgi:hypothetical protein